MIGSHDSSASTVPSSADQERMAAYGIVRVPVDYYHWNGYRYTSLKDAIQAAGRHQSGPEER